MQYGGVIGKPIVNACREEVNAHGISYDGRTVISHILPIAVTYEDGTKKFFFAKGRAIYKNEVMCNGLQVQRKDSFASNVGEKMAEQRAWKAIELFTECNFDRKDFIENYWDTFYMMQIVRKEELSDIEIMLFENREELEGLAKKALEPKPQ